MKNGIRVARVTAGAMTLAGVLVLGYSLGSVDAAGAPTTDPLVYSGVLHDGGKAASGSHQIALGLWKEKDKGSALCQMTAAKTVVTGGRFNVALSADCIKMVRENPKLWIEVQVDGVAVSRRKLGAVPYALEADRAKSVSGLAVSSVPSLLRWEKTLKNWQNWEDTTHETPTLASGTYLVIYQVNLFLDAKPTRDNPFAFQLRASGSGQVSPGRYAVAEGNDKDGTTGGAITRPRSTGSVSHVFTLTTPQKIVARVTGNSANPNIKVTLTEPALHYLRVK